MQNGGVLMTERYGNTRVGKIREAVNDLRTAVHDEGTQRVLKAWDRLEPWIDALASIKGDDA